MFLSLSAPPAAGGAEKYADKWASEGGDVWHEKWGETYNGAGGYSARCLPVRAGPAAAR